MSSRPSVSSLCDTLERDGLIVRQGDPRDPPLATLLRSARADHAGAT